MPQTIVVNSLGKLKGWNSVTTRLLGRDVVGIAKVQYDDDKPSPNAFGAGGYPVGIEDANYTAKASIDLFDEEVREIMKALPAGKRMQDITPFDIPVSFEVPGTGERQTDIIHNCRFTNVGLEVKQNDGKIVRSFNLAVTHITHNQR